MNSIHTNDIITKFSQHFLLCVVCVPLPLIIQTELRCLLRRSSTWSGSLGTDQDVLLWMVWSCMPMPHWKYLVGLSGRVLDLVRTPYAEWAQVHLLLFWKQFSYGHLYKNRYAPILLNFQLSGSVWVFYNITTAILFHAKFNLSRTDSIDFLWYFNLEPSLVKWVGNICSWPMTCEWSQCRVSLCTPLVFWNCWWVRIPFSFSIYKIRLQIKMMNFHRFRNKDKYDTVYSEAMSNRTSFMKIIEL